MTEKIKAFLSLWREDYLFSTVLASAITALNNIAFTVYNGFLGVAHHSAWNGSICVYYLLLALIRSMVVYTQKGALKAHEVSSTDQQRKVYFWTHICLILMNLSLIFPIAVMVRGERSYTLGIIPAIAMAAYTTYRVTISIIHYKKAGRQGNLLASELRTINMIDSLVAVLTLQNALIMVNGGQKAGTITLTAWTSGGILLLTVLITIKSFTRMKT